MDETDKPLVSVLDQLIVSDRLLKLVARGKESEGPLSTMMDADLDRYQKSDFYAARVPGGELDIYERLAIKTYLLYLLQNRL